MISALADEGPLVTVIRADSAIFQGYTSGIINNSCCLGESPKNVNHVVVIVGWAIENE